LAVAGNCSCIAGIPAIHGRKKTPHPFPGAGFLVSSPGSAQTRPNPHLRW